jgi:hypothetical protein
MILRMMMMIKILPNLLIAAHELNNSQVKHLTLPYYKAASTHDQLIIN